LHCFLPDLNFTKTTVLDEPSHHPSRKWRTSSRVRKKETAA
jgi:hypothetical protein